MSLNKKKVSILLIGSSAKTSLELMYLRAFKSCGYKNIYLLDLKKNIFLFKIKYVNYLLKLFEKIFLSFQLIKFFLSKKNVYNIIIIFKGKEIFFKTLKKIKSFSSNSILININPDDPFNTDENISDKNVIKSIKLYDIYCIWSKKIFSRLLRLGYKNIRYLPFALDHTYYDLKKNKKINNHILFIGSWDRRREFFIKKLSYFKIKIYGNGWNNASKEIKENKNIFIFYKEALPLESIKAMNRAAVTLNILRRQNRTSHNMKTFEIPGMGGLMLTERTFEQNIFFSENKYCLMYGGLKELKEKILYAYYNKEANNIRINGMKIARRYSYKDRVNYLVNEIWKIKK
jgi:spore maturation protein CgeB